MKSLLKIKLLLTTFVASSINTYAIDHQHTVSKEDQEFRIIKERINIKIEKIISNLKKIIVNSKKMFPEKSFLFDEFESQEEKIYQDISLASEKIKKKFGLSALLAYEYSLYTFWYNFKNTKLSKSIQNGQESIWINDPNILGGFFRALSFGYGLDVSLENMLHSSKQGNSISFDEHLELELETLFSLFEDVNSSIFKAMVTTRLQKEKNLSKLDVSRILRESFSYFFLVEFLDLPILLKSKKAEDIKMLEQIEKSFPYCLENSIQKIKEEESNSVPILPDVSRDPSKAIAMMERYKKETGYPIEADSVHKTCVFLQMKNNFLDLQKFFGDSSFFVFDAIAKLDKKKFGNFYKNFANFTEFFECCFNKTKNILQIRLNWSQTDPHDFGWDLSCLFINNLENANRENPDYIKSLTTILNQLKKENFSEEQLTKVLKHLFRNETKEWDRVHFLEEMHRNFLYIKTQKNLENKKNSLDILRKALVVFPELWKEKNKITMNGLLKCLPDKNKKDFSDQERKKYEQKLFGIFRIADWEACAEKNHSTSDFIEKVLKILKSDVQAKRIKEQQDEGLAVKTKISALFPENDNLFVESINRVINEYQISEDDTFGIIRPVEKTIPEQKNLEEKIISVFSHQQIYQ